MLSLVFSTFCSNHQKVIEAKRCDFFTTLPGCSSKSDIGVHHKLLAIVNAVATRPMFVLYAVPVPQWILFTVIGEVSQKSHWLISKLCVEKFRNLYERAFNANPDVCIFLDKVFPTCCNPIVTLLQYGWMLRPFLARDSIQSLQLFNAKSQPRPWNSKSENKESERKKLSLKNTFPHFNSSARE